MIVVNRHFALLHGHDCVTRRLLLLLPKKTRKIGGCHCGDNPQTRKVKVDTTDQRCCRPEAMRVLSGGGMPPLVRMRWGARGGAENFLFGARDQPRAPPTMHQTIRRVRTRTHGPEAKIKTEAHQNQETQVQGKKTIRRVREIRATPKRKQNGNVSEPRGPGTRKENDTTSPRKYARSRSKSVRRVCENTRGL